MYIVCFFEVGFKFGSFIEQLTGDSCRSKDAFADHEGCKTGAAHGSGTSLDDRREDCAPWIQRNGRIKPVEENE